MSESGDTPPPRSQCPHHDDKLRRRRRILICAAFAVLALLLLAAAAAIAALVLLRPRDPVTELLSVTATGVLPAVNLTLPAAVSVHLNVTFLLVVRVRNPNPAAFRHGAAATELLYRGAAVGGGEVPAGVVPSRGEVVLRMNMTVDAARFVEAAAGVGGLVADVIDGEMEFEARTDVAGTVVLLGFVKRRVEARSVCRVVVGVVDVQVRRQECHNQAKL
ncbi:hypothetical protein PR202_gb01594 [Eleusine coracana subsp. coracana]|uniref:Late embryogenesis abundant protein LEA-2 subgroup domain-containing protein n=1 Tax=Eleusine coracana subsp. coracana TaxID=191504 RepID=A0AAV5DWN5_ELECO|nr:hypothetical protein QOZ80_5BG0416710 [Eleusine coracana subsp. coracana]GJN14738.1 hypothetical protein PR202_gb01594 [Eleusine coracana subsp. coracana]